MSKSERGKPATTPMPLIRLIASVRELNRGWSLRGRERVAKRE